MNSLLKHLSNRSPDRMRLKQRVLELGILPGLMKPWLERKIWKGVLRHMRSDGGILTAEVNPVGIWRLKSKNELFATSLPLSHLIGEINRPVCIVATGPSAKDHQFESNQLVVAVNGAPTFLREREIPPDLLVVTDPEFATHGVRHFKKAPHVPLVTTFKAAARLAKSAPEELMDRRFSIIERVNAWYAVPTVPDGELDELNASAGSPFHFPDGDRLKYKVGWSDSPELGFFSCCNVVSAALQVVVGLGAIDVRIIGMDLSGTGRVYKEDKDARPSHLEAQYEDYILPGFRVMSEALKGRGISIKNLSPVCPLPESFFDEG